MRHVREMQCSFFSDAFRLEILIETRVILNVHSYGHDLIIGRNDTIF